MAEMAPASVHYVPSEALFLQARDRSDAALQDAEEAPPQVPQDAGTGEVAADRAAVAVNGQAVSSATNAIYSTPGGASWVDNAYVAIAENIAAGIDRLLAPHSSSDAEEKDGGVVVFDSSSAVLSSSAAAAAAATASSSSPFAPSSSSSSSSPSSAARRGSGMAAPRVVCCVCESTGTPPQFPGFVRSLAATYGSTAQVILAHASAPLETCFARIAQRPLKGQLPAGRPLVERIYRASMGLLEAEEGNMNETVGSGGGGGGSDSGGGRAGGGGSGGGCGGSVSDGGMSRKAVGSGCVVLTTVTTGLPPFDLRFDTGARSVDECAKVCLDALGLTCS